MAMAQAQALFEAPRSTSPTDDHCWGRLAMDAAEEWGGADRPKIASREEAERVLGGLARSERSQGYAKTSWEEAMRVEAISFLRAERERKDAIAEAAERRWLRSSNSNSLPPLPILPRPLLSSAC